MRLGVARPDSFGEMPLEYNDLMRDGNTMQFILDVHCHTVNSGHAYSTVTENAAHGAGVGLTHIGIADHGPGMPAGAHLYNFTNIWVLPEFMHGVRVLKGAEANIISDTGKLDLPSDVLKKLDFVIASFHRGSFPPIDRDTHTRAMIMAMENPNMHILGHPGDCWFDIDAEAVVRAAARTGTVIEINNASLNPGSVRYHGDSSLRQILFFCKKFNTKVLASSDAHYHTYVGDLARAKQLIEESGIDEYLVLNTSAERFLETIYLKRSLVT